MLVLSRRARESVIIDGVIEIKVIEISGDKVKLGIEAPREMLVMRKELCQTVESNREAAHVSATPELMSFLATLSLPTDKPDED